MNIKAYVYYPFNWGNAFLLGILGFLFGILLPGLAIAIALILYSPVLPDTDVLEHYTPPLVSVMYAKDGEPLAEFAGEKRIWVPISDVSPIVVNALLATEDRDFYRHWGVSPLGILRAVFKNIKAHRIVQGASTITQQLAQNLFLSREKVLSRKVKEALTSIILEYRYSKSEILELYLNQNYLGKGCYGIESASRVFFGTHANSLRIEQAALLVGLLKGPSYYMRNPQRATKRRNYVIRAMARNKIIPEEMVDSLCALPLGIKEQGEKAEWDAPYFVEYVRRYIRNKYGDALLYTKGVKIYTTLDYSVQEVAESALVAKTGVLQRWNEKIHHKNDTLYTELVFDSTKGDTVRRFKQINGAVVVMEPSTGYIVAMVGGKDFGQSQFNRATQALRQPGSAFKPFVYTAAIDNGWQPSDKIDDTPLVLPMADGKEWRPQNYDHKYLGEITLRDALTHSRNLATIRLCQQVGPKNVVYYAHQMGIKSRLEPYLSIAMGTSDVTPLEMVRAYCTFPNNGIRITPIAIKRIEASDGTVLEENEPRREERLSAGTAYVMTNMLESVIDHGTGYAARLRGFDRPAGGKTGTTNDYSDAWFIGFTPQYCCGVRIGYDDRTPIGESQTGSRAALPVWTAIMLKIHKNLVVRDFEIPIDQVRFLNICKESGLLATSRCPEVEREVFLKKNHIPKDYCPLSHRKGTTTPTFRRKKPDTGTTPNMPSNREKHKRSHL